MTDFEQAMNEYYAHFGAPYPYAVGFGFKGETDEELGRLHFDFGEGWYFFSAERP